MKEVYCKDCLHFIADGCVEQEKIIDEEGTKAFGVDYYNGKPIDFRGMNKNNNCPYFGDREEHFRREAEENRIWGKRLKRKNRFKFWN